jgi:hypothetical protein
MEVTAEDRAANAWNGAALAAVAVQALNAWRSAAWEASSATKQCQTAMAVGIGRYRTLTNCSAKPGKKGLTYMDLFVPLGHL